MKKLISSLMLCAVVLLVGCKVTPEPSSPDIVDSDVVITDVELGCGAGASCGDGEVCDEEQGECVGCLNDGDCPKGVCHPVERGCVTCLDDSDCSSGRCHPLAAICVQCLEDEDCAEGVCDGESLLCIGCLTDADCESGICNTDTRSCVGCASTDSCDDSDPCTVDSCDEGECSYGAVAEGDACDDSDPCTIEETCLSGACTSYVTAQECCESLQCDGNHSPTDTDQDGCDDACAQNECADNTACAQEGYCYFIPGVCGAVAGLCVKAPESCKEKLAPVCACDSKTYESACTASLAKTSVAYEGTCETDCEELLCSTGAKASDLDEDGCPETCVCPDDSEISQEQPCDDVLKCVATKDCEEGDFCAKPTGVCDAMGLCEPMPTECENEGNAVCGCNGKVFESECLASQLGVSVGPKTLCDSELMNP